MKPTKAYLTPAEYIIQLLGGVRKTARAIGRNPSAVCRWNRPKEQGGTDGRIPLNAINSIIVYAKQNDIKLNLADLHFGKRT